MPLLRNAAAQFAHHRRMARALGLPYEEFAAAIARHNRARRTPQGPLN